MPYEGMQSVNIFWQTRMDPRTERDGSSSITVAYCNCCTIQVEYGGIVVTWEMFNQYGGKVIGISGWQARERVGRKYRCISLLRHQFLRALEALVVALRRCTLVWHDQVSATCGHMWVMIFIDVQ